jgi:S-formylglutathione hydrolase FrmB
MILRPGAQLAENRLLAQSRIQTRWPFEMTLLGALHWARPTVLLGLLLLVGIPTARAARPQQAAGGGECRTVQSHVLNRGVAYCVLLPPSYASEPTRRYPVLYFLHGLGDNEQMFLRSGGLDLLEDLRGNHEIGEFLVVTPAGDSSFFINSHDNRVRYEDFFLQEFMPSIERRYRVRPGRTSRGIAGISMGGYGALRLAFVHPGLFGSVSAHSPALMEKLPAISVQGAPGMARLRLLGDVFGSPPDPAFWERNNPIALARTADLRGLKIYFDCGAQDDYGFDAGAKALDRALTARGVQHEFHLDQGGHDWSYFAAHLPASFRFQSRAFGLGAPSASSSN